MDTMLGDFPGCLAVAGLLATALLWSRLRAPLGADEGYLWYGVQQLRRGRWPHRDFKAYEPGRYLWSALFGKQLTGLRVATHAFFALALLAVLMVLRELGVGWTGTACTGIALVAWAHPQHKQFEHGAVALAWAALTHALAAPAPATFALAAATVGLALSIGFNLWLYFGAAGALALGVAIATGGVELDGVRLAALAGGGLLGMAMFLPWLVSPGFAREFHRRRVGSVLARGTSNLPLPRPWPWRAPTAALAALDGARRRGFQALFLLMFAAPPVALAALVAWPGLGGALAPGALAAAALGLFTSHHAASRADLAHIAQAMGAPVLLAVVVAEALWPGASALVAVASLWLAWPLHPWSQRRANPEAFCRRTVGGLAIDHTHAQARLLDAAAALCAAHVGDRTGLLAVPTYPAVYAALERDAPAYDTFCVHPADDRQEREMIAAIERAPVFAALVSDAPLDGRDDLRFSRTHPQVWAYLGTQFAATRRRDLGEDVYEFTARSDSRPGTTTAAAGADVSR
jgi:hypothetical protein